MSERKPPAKRADYPHYLAIPTRWQDNDAYGHVNNVVYLSFADTVANRFLLDAGLDYQNGPVIGLIAENGCRYHRAITYPEPVDAGLRVAHLGRSSVRYEVGLFVPGEDEARAEVFIIHVWVDRATNKSAPIPEGIRRALEGIRIA